MCNNDTGECPKYDPENDVILLVVVSFIDRTINWCEKHRAVLTLIAIASFIALMVTIKLTSLKGE